MRRHAKAVNFGIVYGISEFSLAQDIGVSRAVSYTHLPGWHIECSCISIKHLGEYLDIHCGGIDNAFPHHTNEIAQSEAYLGHKWCNYWFHVRCV